MVAVATEVSVARAQPLLSICIATYNRASLLAQTLQHVRDVFTGNDVEVLVSDNCSSDGTQEVIARFSPVFAHFRSIRQTQNQGMMPNVAAAIALARGEFTYTLNDDDEVCLVGLAAAISIMKSDQAIVAVYGAHQEWVRGVGAVGAPIKMVAQREDFARGEKLRLFNRFSLLWYPVCRTRVLQRFFTYDGRSFGFWELAGALLERGAVAVIPDLIYKHFQTQPRMEYELTKAWYHDQHRAQHEVYMGRVGPTDYRDLSMFINQRVVPAYTHAVRFAEMKSEYLTARQFVLRARAYGSYSDGEIVAWERRCLLYMVAERLLDHVRLAAGIKAVLFEDTQRLAGLREYFASIAPELSVGCLSQLDWQATGLDSGCFLVTYEYAAMGWEQASELGPSSYRAVVDVIETCRITDQPLGL
jgi:glycosyltransferase involved in cell wall biosynthesis